MIHNCDHPNRKVYAMGKCRYCYQKPYVDKFKESNPRTKREYRWRQVGIKNFTYQNFLSLLESQGGMCAICGDDSGTLVPDHDHMTGFVRGLLCGSCNLGLGKFSDNISLLCVAVSYLTQSTGLE